jgi:hypothetical protein
MSAQDILLIIGGLVTLVGAISAAAVAIIKAQREGQDKQAAQAAIYAEQKNRELAVLGATPVTNQAPPMGTGDGRVDAQVTSQLASGPTSPGTVPAVQEVTAPPAAPKR